MRNLAPFLSLFVLFFVNTIFFNFSAQKLIRSIDNQKGIDREFRRGDPVGGYEKEGFDKQGIPSGRKFQHDTEGYERKGYNKKEWERGGYDIYGVNPSSYDQIGRDKEDGFSSVLFVYIKSSLPRKTREKIPKSIERVIARYIFSSIDFDKKSGWNSEKKEKINIYTFTNYNRAGWDREGYNRSGYNKEGYDREGYNRSGYNKEGYDKEGNNRLGNLMRILFRRG